MDIFLASQSPRRKQLLELLHVPFIAKGVDAEEDLITLVDMRENVVERALLKGMTVHAQKTYLGSLILAADTAVSFNNQMLNKPKDAQHAKEMLLALSGQSHEVHTGVALIPPDASKRVVFVETAVVTMRPYTDAEIDAYIQTGDPMDKAGAYAIQHPIFKPVATLDGCYLNVMGLPLCQLITHLQQFNLKPSPACSTLQKAHQHYHCQQLNLIC